MLRKLLFAAAVAAIGFAPAAHAAQTSFSIVFSEGPSTGIVCTPTAGSFTLPAPAGELVASCTVSPSTWTGSVALSGTSASSFVVAQVGGSNTAFNVSVGASPYNTVGTVNLTATSAP